LKPLFAVFIGSAALAGSVTIVAAQAGGGSAISVSAQAPPGARPAASKPVTVSVPRPLLPESFAGWTATAPPKTVTDAEQVDKDNAAALKEYGFASAMLATYKKDN
jgi:uncharacterized protein YcnI